MRLPKDRVFSTNLRTSFIDYDALLRCLAEERFDGYAALQGDGYRGWLFVAGGEVAGARDGNGVMGAEAVRGFETKARQPGQCMNIYRAPAAQMRLLGADREAEPVFPPLPSDFVNLHRMMDTLSRGGHSGYVELAIRSGDAVGYVLFEEGTPMEAIFSDGRQTETGLGLVPEIVEAVEQYGAEITVFRTATIKASKATMRDDHDARQQGTSNDDSPLEDRDADEVAAAWSAIFSAVGEVVDGMEEPGSFDEGLRDAMSEHALTYPFLDSGRGRLTYQHGTVRFVAPPPEEISQALGECLNEAIARISFRARKFDLEARIQQRLETVVATHGEAIRRHGIARAAAPLLAA